MMSAEERDAVLKECNDNPATGGHYGEHATAKLWMPTFGMILEVTPRNGLQDVLSVSDAIGLEQWPPC